jgi:hypothetical protein
MNSPQQPAECSAGVAQPEQADVVIAITHLS